MGYEFTLVLDRAPSDDDLDALFNAGCFDATFQIESGESVGHFVRKSESLTHAIATAVHDVENAGLSTAEVRRDEIGDPTLRQDYAREIAAANLMASYTPAPPTDTFSGRAPSAPRPSALLATTSYGCPRGKDLTFHRSTSPFAHSPL